MVVVVVCVLFDVVLIVVGVVGLGYVFIVVLWFVVVVCWVGVVFLFVYGVFVV